MAERINESGLIGVPDAEDFIRRDEQDRIARNSTKTVEPVDVNPMTTVERTIREISKLF